MPRPLAASLGVVADRVMPATLLAEVQRAWPGVAGALAANAEPVRERGGVVTVACEWAVLAQELDLMAEAYVAALNERLGREAVLRLRFEATQVRR